MPLIWYNWKEEFKWETDQQEAFDRIKGALSSEPVLSFPNNKDLFILDSDASDFAIGAELSQVQDGKEKVIAYSSLGLSPEQKRYCVTRKELLAVARFTRQFRHYLIGRHFVIRTDHKFNMAVEISRSSGANSPLVRRVESIRYGSAA